MLSLLKAQVGPQYTAKIECMINDMVFAEENNVIFHNSTENKMKVTYINSLTIFVSYLLNLILLASIWSTRIIGWYMATCAYRCY
jgi:hypothetical protein